MRQLLIDLGAIKTEDNRVYVNGVRFVPAKQNVMDDLRAKGDYGRYLRACREEIAKEEKTIERQTVRVSDELINQIFEGSEMGM